MKKPPLNHLLILLTLLLAARATAQTPNCYHVAVWDLSAADKDRDIAEQIADEIEGLLIEIPGCIQIEQRHRASIQRIINESKKKQDVSELPKNAQDQLKALDVRYVIFGSIIREESVKTNVLVSLHLDEIATQRKVGRVSIRLSGNETLTENLQSSLRPGVYKLVGATPPSDAKDPAWDKANRIDTRPAYEAYLLECGTCPHRNEAQAIITDEKAWEEVLALQRPKAQMNGLVTYLQKGNTRHLSDKKGAYGAQTLLRNHLETQDRMARREWKLCSVFTGAGLVAGVFGLWMEDQSKADYAFYEQNLDAGDLTLYADRSRDDYYTRANQKHVRGQWLQAGGITLFTCGACFMVKRLTWTQTLKNGRQMLYRPTLSAPVQMGFRSNSIGLGLQVRF